MSLGHGNCLESGIAWSWVILLEIDAVKSWNKIHGYGKCGLPEKKENQGSDSKLT